VVEARRAAPPPAGARAARSGPAAGARRASTAAPGGVPRASPTPRAAAAPCGEASPPRSTPGLRPGPLPPCLVGPPTAGEERSGNPRGPAHAGLSGLGVVQGHFLAK